jgi:hypothetical protein
LSIDSLYESITHHEAHWIGSDQCDGARELSQETNEDCQTRTDKWQQSAIERFLDKQVISNAHDRGLKKTHVLVLPISRVCWEDSRLTGFRMLSSSVLERTLALASPVASKRPPAGCHHPRIDNATTFRSQTLEIRYDMYPSA